MNVNSSTHKSIASSYDRVLAISLTTISMFILGYSATRVMLNYSATASAPATAPEVVTPHQASMWSAFGETY